jgi:hypothetical protein
LKLLLHKFKLLFPFLSNVLLLDCLVLRCGTAGAVTLIYLLVKLINRIDPNDSNEYKDKSEVVKDHPSKDSEGALDINFCVRNRNDQ